MVEPIPAAKWGVEVIVKSHWAEHNLQLVDYPDEFAQQIKLYNCVVVDGKELASAGAFTLEYGRTR